MAASYSPYFSSFFLELQRPPQDPEAKRPDVFTVTAIHRGKGVFLRHWQTGATLYFRSEKASRFLKRNDAVFKGRSVTHLIAAPCQDGIRFFEEEPPEEQAGGDRGLPPVGNRDSG